MSINLSGQTISSSSALSSRADLLAQLHKMVDDLDVDTVKPGLHANVDDLDDASLPAGLVRMRALRSLFDRWGGSEKLHGLTAELIDDARAEGDVTIPESRDAASSKPGRHAFPPLLADAVGRSAARAR
jgi:hypothetical protein